MKGFSLKVKLIFIPFLITVVSTVLVYTFLNWLLLIKLEVFNVDEMFIDVVGPLIVPGISILIWLLPRIKLLRLVQRRNRDPLMGYIVIAWAVIGLTIGTSQQYLVTATGKITKIDHISQINNLPKTKYYTLKYFYIDKKLARITPLHKITEKGRSYDMYLYIPCPILDRDFASDKIVSSLPRDTINNI